MNERRLTIRTHHDAAALGTVLGIWAHPDDETYLCGGTMAALRDAGHRVVCITATRGEAGGQAAPEDLWRTRTEELDRALAVLGVEDHLWLDLPDGRLAEIDPVEPTARLAHVLRMVRPRTVLTFGPDGITGHPDHITVGHWTRDAFAAAGLDRSESQLLEATSTVGHHARFAELEHRLGVYVGEPATPAEEDALAVHARLDGPLLDRKLHALMQQASQTAPLRAALGIDIFRSWIATEAFRRAQ